MRSYVKTLSDYRSADPPPDRPSLLTVVLPVHNEQEVLPQTYERLTAMAAAFADLNLNYEILFVDDGSTDRSPKVLDDLAAADAHVSVAHLTRNFGHQAAISAGLSLARGDAVAIMDSDLQDPPEELPRFLDKWREGHQVVYAVREKRKEWLGKRLAYWLFYRVYAAISEVPMPLDSGDFCVMDRSAVDLLTALPERQRFVRGLRSWVGLKQVGVRYERPPRAAGTPSYTLMSLFRLAADGLVSFSTVPLRLVTRLGLVGVAAALLLGLWIVGAWLYELVYGGDTPRGWASLACLVLLMSSVQLLSLGVIGEYVARVFLEAKQRPTYLIARVVGGSGSDGGEDRSARTAQTRPGSRGREGDRETKHPAAKAERELLKQS